jgi:hypothetical protein
MLALAGGAGGIKLFAAGPRCHRNLRSAALSLPAITGVIEQASLGESDEYFWKNHERDFWNQG